MGCDLGPSIRTESKIGSLSLLSGSDSQFHHAQLVGTAAAHPEFDLLARGEALLRVGMQAGQVHRLMGGNRLLLRMVPPQPNQSRPAT